MNLFVIIPDLNRLRIKSNSQRAFKKNLGGRQKVSVAILPREKGWSMNKTLQYSGASRTAWYRVKESRRPMEPDPQTVSLVREIGRQRPICGTRRMAAQISRQTGVPTNRKRIQRICRKIGRITPKKTKNDITRAGKREELAADPGKTVAERLVANQTYSVATIVSEITDDKHAKSITGIDGEKIPSEKFRITAIDSSTYTLSITQINSCIVGCRESRICTCHFTGNVGENLAYAQTVVCQLGGTIWYRVESDFEYGVW